MPLFSSPIQPYFVLNTTAYYKRCMYGMGISHFYEFVCDCVDAADTVVVPDGTIDVIFCCDPQQPEAVVYGSVACAGTQMFEAGKRYFGVRFAPGLVVHFSDISAGELVGNAVSLLDLKDMSPAVGQIASAPDFFARIDIFVRCLYPLIGINTGSADGHEILTGQILFQINRTRGTVSLKELEEELHYSRRHMNRVFQAQTGFSIKRFCRYVRFQNLLGILKENPSFTVLEASEEAGYYDQNHLQKEFREFAQTTPKSFRDELRKAHYPDRIIKE